MEIARLDPWTKRLSTRAQVEAAEHGAGRDAEEFRTAWLPEGVPFRDRQAAREWLTAIGADSGDEISFSFDDRNDDFNVATSSNAFFEHLAPVAEKLAQDYDWTLPSVRAWLITRGARPVVHSIRMTVPEMPPTPGIDDEDREEAFVRYFLTPPKVTLEIRLDTPPKVVLDYYKEAQALYEDESRITLERSRAMADWTLELVAFTVNRNDGRAWPQLLEEWNAATPKEWHFDSSKHINLAARAGYRKLMGRELDWNGPSVRPAQPRRRGVE